MYIVKIKEENKDVYKCFYSKPINPYYVAYNFYKDGHSYMNEEEFEEYENERDNPGLYGIDNELDTINKWCDVSSNNEFEILSEFVVDCILQGKKLKYDTPLFVEPNYA